MGDDAAPSLGRVRLGPTAGGGAAAVTGFSAETGEARAETKRRLGKPQAWGGGGSAASDGRRARAETRRSARRRGCPPAPALQPGAPRARPASSPRFILKETRKPEPFRETASSRSEADNVRSAAGTARHIRAQEVIGPCVTSRGLGNPQKLPRATGGSVHIGEVTAVVDRSVTHRHVGVFGTVP